MMNPRRFTTVVPAFCGSLVFAGLIVGWLAGFGSAGTENTGAVPIENGAAALAANARLADEPQAIAMANAADAAAAGAEVATAAEPVTGTATDTTAASDKPEIDRRGRVARSVADAARNTGAGDAGFSVSHLLRLVRTAAVPRNRRISS